MGVIVIFDRKKLPVYDKQSMEKTCYFWQRKIKTKDRKNSFMQKR